MGIPTYRRRITYRLSNITLDEKKKIKIIRCAKLAACGLNDGCS